ncbi:MAG: LysM domain-containing protein [Chloroflexi bacterium]|nr:MAG: LysM domain-containing protein [Chloroflexota bacterium]
MKKILTVIALVAALQLLLVSASYAAPPAWGGGGTYHRVMYGETLHSIGRMYNAHPNCLADANGLWDPNVIYAGQVLYIPAGCPSYPWHAMYPPANPCNPCAPPPPCNPCTPPPPPCNPCTQPPVEHPCNDCGWQPPCDSGCSWQPPVPTPYYGYDYTGYYYGQGNNRYSHTCGYNNNCW